MCSCAPIPALAGVACSAAAWPGGGRGAALLPGSAFGAAGPFATALADAERIAGATGVVLSDGPVPGDCDLTVLRELGERAAA